MATLEKPTQKKPKKKSIIPTTHSKQINETSENIITKEKQDDQHTQKKETQDQSTSAEQSGSQGELTESDEYYIISSADTRNEANPITQRPVELTSNESTLEHPEQCPIPSEEQNIRTVEELMNAVKELTIAPSAPVFLEEPVNYPLLPQQETSQVSQPVKIKETLKPFTKEQLAQLYSNSELEASREFETCFVQSELRPGALTKHPLHKLISNYALAKEKLHNNQVELERLHKEMKSCEESAWIIENAVVSGSSTCQDNHSVYASHSYQTCKLQRGVMDEISRLQKQIYRLANDTHLTCSYTSASLRVQVEHYLERAVVGSRSELRACLSVLFRWARIVGPVSKEARNWLGGVVSALLPGADWQDHAYILCHVLRCPAGVATWAAAYVQVPLPSESTDAFCDKHVNHAVCVLGMLMRGAAARRDFLTPVGGPQSTSDDPWVLVDSDGEEDADAPFCLRENDLVALLNQVPIGDLFSKALGLSETGVHLDEHRLLRLFAFSHVLINLLNDGLSTYGTGGPRYQQFCKRLCRLMGHVLRHACDAHELSQSISDNDVKSRLQMELDALFLHCAKYLHQAERLGAWQFLAVLPFHCLSTHSAWSFCRMIHTGDYDIVDDVNRKDLETPELRQVYEERLMLLSVEASYYLLNTYANMAAEIKDEELAKYLTLRLLDTGFVCECSRDSCTKSAAALLGSTCLRRPDLMSEIISEAGKQLARIGPLAAQLFRELPLHLWRPTPEDFVLLAQWLLEQVPTSLESCLARIAFLELDWNALAIQTHNNIALLIVEHVEKYGETPWAWQLVHKLHLHATDTNGDIHHIPELGQMAALHRVVRIGNSPIANYLTLMMTQHGHMVPMICTHGITQLQLLVKAGQNDAAAIAIGHLIPLFADCTPDTLANSQTFQGVLQALITADRTYVKMAKSFVPSIYEPGKTVQLLVSAIEHNMLHGQWRRLLVIWANILLAQPQWQKDQAVLYLLDSVVRISFFDEQAYCAISTLCKEILERRSDELETSVGSILSWVSGNNFWPPLLLPQAGSSQNAWLAYACLDAEHIVLERRTGLWFELLHQLRQQAGKTNVDACLRRACQKCKIPSYSSSGLCIYRWAQLAMDTSLEHPLLPCLWQNFFHMYLERSIDNTQYACVGSKFFDGVVNTTFCKKLKKHLQETVQATSDERCSKVYRAFSLWLDEPLIQDGSLYLPSLPAQYESAYLSQVLERTSGEKPWRELCNAGAVRDARRVAANGWNQALGRNKSASATITPNNKTVELPITRIRRRLAEHDRPLAAPVPVSCNKCPVGELRLTDVHALSVDLQRHIKRLAQEVELYMLQLSEHQALDQQFKELLPHLYKMCAGTKTKSGTCGGTCAGPGSIRLRFTEARANDAIRQQLLTNRSNMQALLSRAGQTISEGVVSCCATIERAACFLQETNSPLGAELYFLVATHHDDLFEVYPPARSLVRACCSVLGRAASDAQHCARLIHTALTAKCPASALLAAKYFQPPPDIPTNDFLIMYKELIDHLKDGSVAGELLKRLDIQAWLRGSVGKPPRLADRSKFIALVFVALKNSTEQTHALVRLHLVYVFTHEFPEHYGEVLQLALQASADGGLNNTVWRDLLQALAKPCELTFSDGDNPLLSEQQLRQAVAQGRALRQDVLADTCALLGRYFNEERRQHGSTYGLYVRYGSCVRELAALCAVVSHALVWAAVSGAAAPADRLAELAFQRIADVHAPWLLPTQDTQPWTVGDGPKARLMLASFVSCVTFLLDALPTGRGALCHMWQLYCAAWARPGISDHILREVHAALSLMPWQRHWPTLEDVDAMTRLACAPQLSVACRTFTCRLLLQTDWFAWLARLDSGNAQHGAPIRARLLQLLVRLPGESDEPPEQACRLLEQATRWDWRLLPPQDLAHAIDWCITTIDPRAALLIPSENNQVPPLEIDRAIVRLLAVVSYYTPELFQEQLTPKRQLFIRACVRLIASCAGRYKQLLSQQPQLVARTLTHHLDLIETLCGQGEDCQVLISELLQLVNCAALCEASASCLEAWLNTRAPTSQILSCLWHTCACTVLSAEQTGRLLEVSLSTYFSDGQHKPNWSKVAVELRPGTPRQPTLEQQLASTGRLLALHACTLKRLNTIATETDRVAFLDNLVNLSSDVRLSEGIEPKLFLLWRHILAVSYTQALNGDQSRVVTALRRWVAQLSTLAESKQGTFRSVLGALTGSSKPVQLSPQGRLLCRTVAGYVLAQLPTAGSVRCSAHAPSHVGTPGGNADCARLLLKMDAGLSDELRHLAEVALKEIQDPANSLHNAVELLQAFVERIYSQPYLKNYN